MIDEIKLLLNTGYKIKDISKKLNIGTSMVKKYCALINLYSSTEGKLSSKSQKTLYSLGLKAIALTSIKTRYKDLDCILSNINPNITRNELTIIVDAVKETRTNIDRDFILNIQSSKNNTNNTLIKLAMKYLYFKNYTCCSYYKIDNFEIDVIGYNIKNDKVVIIQTMRKDQIIKSIDLITNYCDELYVLTNDPNLSVPDGIGILFINKLSSSKNIKVIKKSYSYNRSININNLLFNISRNNTKKFLFKY
ncbi:hypothetical protein [Clostridium baratii]|uniref:hypothetical protein n=1 Tax=Clostridium baratii TaxID=1561 RepID=UPI0005F299DF|nr:hypothetical protein [Clostridium baratii]AQM58532.1 hypothetical protein NPD11_3063 [Clostridium baratii]KJU70929.1 hypothetical protein UC77_12215 [Clostridium baratii]